MRHKLIEVPNVRDRARRLLHHNDFRTIASHDPANYDERHIKLGNPGFHDGRAFIFTS